MGVLLLFLLSIWLLGPIVWLVNRLRNRETRSLPPVAHLSPWLAALNGVLLLAFIVALTVVFFALAFDNNTVVLFGMPGNATPLFILPIICLLLTLGMLYGNVAAWQQGFWSVARRIYYALLTLAALGCLAVLWNWGMFTALI
ncbi:MAG: hypothetical protein HC914_02035 [Chloroflexaceae bacterium]|nr:hypothetical protein [Chloroflexaceae bacterium]